MTGNNIINIQGKKLGKLTVLCFLRIRPGEGAIWKCLCDCGCTTEISGSRLRKGRTKSCGCLHLKHGQNRRGKTTRAYGAWRGMFGRCYNPNNHKYVDYGARGIKVCQRWWKFENFFTDMGHPPKGKSLDRIDNSIGYSKCNCRWATALQQGRNKRNNVLLTFNGQIKCMSEWAQELNIRVGTLHARLKQGWSVKRALTTSAFKGRNQFSSIL